MNDQISSGGGGDPHHKQEYVAKRRRMRRNASTDAVGELAFVLYSVSRANLPSEQRWHMLSAKLLAWAGAHLQGGATKIKDGV